MIKLREMLQGLSDSVLPHGTLPVPVVQPAVRTQEMMASGCCAVSLRPPS